MLGSILRFFVAADELPVAHALVLIHPCLHGRPVAALPEGVGAGKALGALQGPDSGSEAILAHLWGKASPEPVVVDEQGELGVGVHGKPLRVSAFDSLITLAQVVAVGNGENDCRTRLRLTGLVTGVSVANGPKMAPFYPFYVLHKSFAKKVQVLTFKGFLGSANWMFRFCHPVRRSYRYDESCPITMGITCIVLSNSPG